MSLCLPSPARPRRRASSPRRSLPCSLRRRAVGTRRSLHRRARGGCGGRARDGGVRGTEARAQGGCSGAVPSSPPAPTIPSGVGLSLPLHGRRGDDAPGSPPRPRSQASAGPPLLLSSESRRWRLLSSAASARRGRRAGGRGVAAARMRGRAGQRASRHVRGARRVQDDGQHPKQLRREVAEIVFTVSNIRAVLQHAPTGHAGLR